LGLLEVGLFVFVWFFFFFLSSLSGGGGGGEKGLAMRRFYFEGELP